MVPLILQVVLRETKDAEKSTPEKYTYQGSEQKDRDTTGDLVEANRRTNKTRFEVGTTAMLRILHIWEVTMCH
jgi:hypothetical protein